MNKYLSLNGITVNEKDISFVVFLIVMFPESKSTPVLAEGGIFVETNLM